MGTRNCFLECPVKQSPQLVPVSKTQCILSYDSGELLTGNCLLSIISHCIRKLWAFCFPGVLPTPHSSGQPALSMLPLHSSDSGLPIFLLDRGSPPQLLHTETQTSITQL